MTNRESAMIETLSIDTAPDDTQDFDPEPDASDLLDETSDQIRGRVVLNANEMTPQELQRRVWSAVLSGPHAPALKRAGGITYQWREGRWVGLSRAEIRTLIDSRVLVYWG
jgi:hypothetical protein